MPHSLCHTDTTTVAPVLQYMPAYMIVSSWWGGMHPGIPPGSATAPGVLKNRKFPLLGRSDPFFSTSHRHHRGRAADNLPINFGENRFVKNFLVFWGLCDPFFQNFHQRLEEHPTGYLCTRIGKIWQGNSQVTALYSIQ
jgi:hypothetical protein